MDEFELLTTANQRRRHPRCNYTVFVPGMLRATTDAVEPTRRLYVIDEALKIQDMKMIEESRDL